LLTKDRYRRQNNAESGGAGKQTFQLLPPSPSQRLGRQRRRLASMTQQGRSRPPHPPDPRFLKKKKIRSMKQVKTADEAPQRSNANSNMITSSTAASATFRRRHHEAKRRHGAGRAHVRRGRSSANRRRYLPCKRPIPRTLCSVAMFVTVPSAIRLLQSATHRAPSALQDILLRGSFQAASDRPAAAVPSRHADFLADRRQMEMVRQSLSGRDRRAKTDRTMIR